MNKPFIDTPDGTDLFQDEHGVVEELLELLVRIVDTQLLETVYLGTVL